MNTDRLSTGLKERAARGAVYALLLALCGMGFGCVRMYDEPLKIVYSRNIGPVYQLFVMDENGESDSMLTNGAASNFNPSWSADTGRIVFVSNRDGNYEIYSMDADGKDQRRLTAVSAPDYTPTWSPDGRRIAFVSDRDGNQEIYIMNADGTGPVNITNHSENDSGPSWSPDGERIVFSGQTVPGQRNIYSIRPDGTDRRALTGVIEDEDYPCFQGKPR